MLPAIFVWSVGVHAVVILVVLKLQQLTVQVTIPRGVRFSTTRELLYSIAWVVMTLENTYLFVMWSKMGGVVALGLRVFSTSMIFNEVHGNPCGAVFYYLDHWPSKKLSSLLRPLCAQLLAVPMGIAISMIMWNLLAIVNKDYSGILDKEVEYFLFVHPFAGFFIEASISFLMFMPKILIPSSAFLHPLQAFFCMFLVYHVGILTGAFMNPMSAFACYLVWHSHYLGLWDFLVHLFVFLLGPILGTCLAVGVQKYVKRTPAKSKELKNT